VLACMRRHDMCHACNACAPQWQLRPARVAPWSGPTAWCRLTFVTWAHRVHVPPCGCRQRPRRSPARPFLPVRVAFLSVVASRQDGTVEWANSLGRCLEPACQLGHIAEFANLEAFTAAYVAAHRPIQGVVQVGAFVHGCACWCICLCA